MEFKRGFQGPQQVMGAVETYAPPTLSNLGVAQGFYTVESLEKSQPQIFPPGTYAYQSSDGTVPPGSSYSAIAMQPPQHDQAIAYQSARPSEYASYASSVPAEYGKASLYSEAASAAAHGRFGVDLSLHSRVTPGSMVPPRYGYGLEDHYVPEDHYVSILSGNSSSGLFQQASSLLAYAATTESESVREHLGYSRSYLGLTANNSQVFNSGSTGTAKKKIASQNKRISTLAATRKNSVHPPKVRVPAVSGPGAPGWCFVCEIECNSKEVLEQHCLGRKHKRRLEKKEELLTAQANPKEKNMQQSGSGNMDKSLKRENKAGTQVLSDNSLLKSRNQEPTRKLHLSKNTNAGGEAEAKASNSTLGKRKEKIAAVDIRTKRQRLLDAGTDILAVKVCNLCKTVCNSQIVFDAHLAGKKHAAQVKMLEEEANAVSQVNKLDDRANSVLQGNKLEEDAIALPQPYKSQGEANVTSQGIHSAKECTDGGELDHKDGKAE